MLNFNITDIRFLLSALIQILPTVLSITLIALFAFPGFVKYYSGKIKKCATLALGMVVIFFIAIMLDIVVLSKLEYFIKQSLVLFALLFSFFAIIYLYIFIGWILVQVVKHQEK